MATPQLHHIGFVVRSVEEAAPRFARYLSDAVVSPAFYDPLQRVRVLFLYPPGSAAIELVEPAATGSEVSPVAAFLARGGGLHHLCYEVPDIVTHIADMKTRRAALVRPPTPAVAFAGRRIAWMLTADKLLVEYLEAEAK